MVATTTPSSPEQGGNRAGTAHGILIIMAAVMPAMAIISLVPVLPMLEQEFAAIEGSEFLVPVALTIPAFCLAIFSPVAGWLTDRIGRKSLLVGALALYSVLGTAPFFLADLKQIIASRFALGITEALIMTAATTLVGDYFQDARRERWLGIQVSAVSVAAIAMAAISGGLGQAFGARGPFLMYIIALPLAIACQWVLFEPTDKQQATASTTERFPLLRMVPLLLAGLSLGILFYVVLVKLGDILCAQNRNFAGVRWSNECHHQHRRGIGYRCVRCAQNAAGAQHDDGNWLCADCERLRVNSRGGSRATDGRWCVYCLSWVGAADSDVSDRDDGLTVNAEPWPRNGYVAGQLFPGAIRRTSYRRSTSPTNWRSWHCALGIRWFGGGDGCHLRFPKPYRKKLGELLNAFGLVRSIQKKA